MTFDINFDADQKDGGAYRATVHRSDCGHALKSDEREHDRYWVRDVMDADAVRRALNREIKHLQKRVGRTLSPRACKHCKPGAIP